MRRHACGSVEDREWQAGRYLERWRLLFGYFGTLWEKVHSTQMCMPIKPVFSRHKRGGVQITDEPTGALDSKNAKALMEKLAGLNRDENATILMVTHDSNAASYCRRILFIQDGVIFHELRRNVPDETRPLFYERILMVMAQLGGGSANVL